MKNGKAVQKRNPATSDTMELVLRFYKKLGGEPPALLQQRDGALFLQDEDGTYKPVTVTEALQWYVRYRLVHGSESDTGDIAEIIGLAVGRGGPPPKGIAQTKPMVVNVGMFGYGVLNEAAAHHGCSVDKALDLYVNHGNMLPEWANQDYDVNVGTD